MFANSRTVDSAQTGPHEKLAALVMRHRDAAFRKPLAAYSAGAFEAAVAAWRSAGSRPLVIDAGCGVGESTLRLATRFPDHFVIGVDQSESRIVRGKDWWDGVWPENFVWVRADLVDFWRQLHDAGIRPARHYILYPNPWPKIGQLARRWHAHAVFPTVVALGGALECRSNWGVYIDEFALAVELLSGVRPTVEKYSPAREADAITPFERKYLASGHGLYRSVVTLSPGACGGRTDLL
ncbi:tRNA (guanine(46)-N(7))-methyltransferase TrmB [Pandoraea pulmonicola]|uniref:tRNA (guanine(46)-N(7))-methyltransferase n=1 Tax=Pandoraea pulmonicola TaxID=93221 RepID=A0AAJ4Z987_PANPU|nr:methyltransferase domain-containing protein [Pandoraea pulmonicola]AJC21924.1 SAM-dependent methyltransferase [Pandoraea pulmonicola]SUA89128.1 tRNA (guanine-N(7)-)-methyltransferase [Pandoraea pulmonicola]